MLVAVVVPLLAVPGPVLVVAVLVVPGVVHVASLTGGAGGCPGGARRELASERQGV